MSCNECNKKPACEQNMEVQELVDLPIDSIDEYPDYFLVERAILDDTTGKVLHTLTRFPANAVMPNGNNANLFTLDGNNPSLELVEDQPLPAYVQNEGVSNRVYPADANHAAQFFVLGTLGDRLICQASGVMEYPGGTDYIVGMTYYQSNTAGEFTTNPGETNRPAFYVASPTKLIIKL